MKNPLTTIITIALAAGFLIWKGDQLLTINSRDLSNSSYSASTINSLPESSGENVYRNDQYRFVLTVPEGLETREMQTESSMILVIEGDRNSNQNDKPRGVQVTITPLPLSDEVYELTGDDIKNELPNLNISDPQLVDISGTHKGVAFISDNPSFGGQSREVWFVYNKTLYQISTYAYSDDLLREIFNTWKFY